MRRTGVRNKSHREDFVCEASSSSFIVVLTTFNNNMNELFNCHKMMNTVGILGTCRELDQSLLFLSSDKHQHQRSRISYKSCEKCEPKTSKRNSSDFYSKVYLQQGSIDRFGTLKVGCTSETQIRKKKTSEDSLRLWSTVF